ncbi:Os10g0151366, partial [Oryza sativa Japonica Group]
ISKNTHVKILFTNISSFSNALSASATAVTLYLSLWTFSLQPMIYGRGPAPARMMVPMVLPDGRLGYVL